MAKAAVKSKKRAKPAKGKKHHRGVLDLPKAVETRMAEGRAERESVPLEAHGEWAASDGRPDPVGILEEQNATRVPELVPIRHGRMIVSPFTFYRGGAAIMASDLSQTPSTGLRVQCCGDAHLSNFGVFAAPDRRLVFDLNDFDETLPAPFEWDVKRLVASFVVAARDNGHRRKEQRAAARAAAAAYRTTMARATAMRFLEVWYARIDAEDLLTELAAREDKATIKAAQKGLAKARKRTSLGSLSKFAERVDGGYRIKQQPPVIVRPPDARYGDLEQIIRQGLADYARSLSPERRLVLDHYHYVDFARKVVGVGSVGTEAFMVLLMGDRDDDPLFLQVKEADTSVLAPYAGAGEYEQQGERVVHGQRIMQAASDPFLGWATGTGARGREFYVRQLRDMKGSAVIEAMPPARLARYGEVCGVTLARAHARSGDAAKIAGYLGDDDTFDRALEQFAVAYADQNDADYAAVHRRRGRAAHRGRTRRVAPAAQRLTVMVPDCTLPWMEQKYVSLPATGFQRVNAPGLQGPRIELDGAVAVGGDGVGDRPVVAPLDRLADLDRGVLGLVEVVHRHAHHGGHRLRLSCRLLLLGCRLRAFLVPLSSSPQPPSGSAASARHAAIVTGRLGRCDSGRTRISYLLGLIEGLVAELHCMGGGCITPIA